MEKERKKQGRIHSNPVADGWAGEIMRKPLGIQKCDLPTYGRTDLPTRQGVVACPRLKTFVHKFLIKQGALISHNLALFQEYSNEQVTWPGVTISLRTGGWGRPTPSIPQLPHTLKHTQKVFKNAHFPIFQLVLTDGQTLL